MRLDSYEVSLKTRFILKQFEARGITQSRDGVPVEDMEYEDLKRELAIMRHAEIDTDNSENYWF